MRRSALFALVTACASHRASEQPNPIRTPTSTASSAPAVVTSTGPRPSSVSSLPAGVAPLVTQYRTVTFTSGKTIGTAMPLTIGYGSAAFHDPSEPATDVWTAGDRGPNFGCTDTNSAGEPFTGIAKFCGDGGVVFPVSNYAPSLYHVRFSASGGALTAIVIATVIMHDASGQPISGLSNTLDAPPYSSLGTALAADSDGIDPEGLARLADGSFWVSEEYAPSLVHIAADGTVLERVVPAGTQLVGASYPVDPALPAILAQREANRGIESLGVSPDQTTLYFALQSPLANPDDDAFASSGNVRLFAAALNTDGSFAALTHEYVYVLDTPAQFADPAATKQSNIFLSELTVLADGRILLDEHTDAVTTLTRVDLTHATDILGSKWDTDTSKTTLETLTLPANGIVAVGKTRVFDSRIDAPTLEAKIEGVAILDGTYALLVNDNDFGIDGAITRFNVLPIVSQLTR